MRSTRCTVLVLLAAAAILTLLATETNPSLGVVFLAMVFPVGAWLMIAHDERSGRPVDPRLVAVAAGVLLAAAVVLPPAGSKDVWSYASYGRMVSHYGVSPFTHVPAEFRHDPFFRLVGSSWTHTPSVYGPLFVVIAAAGSQLVGTSVLLMRLFHQSLAAGAVALALVLVWRETRRVAAIAFLGLNPLVVVNVVNNGHNDALVGLALLGAALLASRRRFALAGIVVGAAALIKITAALAVPALVVWALWRYGWRPARSAAIGAAATIGGVYLVAGAAAIAALGTNKGIMSSASLWQLPREAFAIPGNEWISLFSAGSVVLVAALALAVAWTCRREHDAARAMALAVGAYLVAGLYVLPWYVIWVIPIACLTSERRLRVLMFTLCTLLPGVYAVKGGSVPHAVYPQWLWLSTVGVPIVLFVLFAVALPSRRRSPRRTAPLVLPRPEEDSIGVETGGPTADPGSPPDRGGASRVRARENTGEYLPSADSLWR